MKNLKEIIQEKLVFNKHTKAKNHNYFNTCDELVRYVNDLYYIKLSDKVQNDIIESIKSHLKDKLDINKYIFVISRKIIREQFAIDLITDSGEAYLSHKEFYQERAIYFDDDISVFYESVMLTRQTGIVKFLIFVNYKNSCIHHYCLIDKNDINKYNLNENLQPLDEKLVFNKHTKEKQYVSIENILTYLNETYNLPVEIEKLWQQDEFYDSHYSNELINCLNKYITPQKIFCTKPILVKQEVNELIRKLKNNEYNNGIIYVKELGRLNGLATNSVGLIYDYTLDKYFLNSSYNKS